MTLWDLIDKYPLGAVFTILAAIALLSEGLAKR